MYVPYTNIYRVDVCRPEPHLAAHGKPAVPAAATQPPLRAVWWLRLAAWFGLGHRYLSTGCLHGDHAYCASRSGLVGPKHPARCKFCPAACRCRCHKAAQ